MPFTLVMVGAFFLQLLPLLLFWSVQALGACPAPLTVLPPRLHQWATAAGRQT